MEKVTEGLLIDVIEEMCDDYCFYVTVCRDEDTLHQHCEECPMTRLMKIMEEEYEG